VRCCTQFLPPPRIIGEVISGDLMQMPEFSLNFALLHTWQARHGGARRLNI
ncbi:TPA: hypothetical protein ACGASI_006711, partial [Pseudomonas aeruginosa]